MNIAMVISAYNEEKNIQAVVQNTKEYIKDIIVVDDGSNDNTAKKAREAGAIVLQHLVNLGKGSSAKTGCDYVYSCQYDAMILMDGDGQHDPREIPNFIVSLKSADLILGSRKFDQNMPFVLKTGNQLINWVTKVLYGIKVKDTQSGYRAFTRKAYEKIRWKSGDYSMESEMIANAGKEKINYLEIPIKTIYNDKHKGTTIIDGIKIVFNMLIWRIKI